MTPDDQSAPDTDVQLVESPTMPFVPPDPIEVRVVERAPEDPFDMGSDEGPDGEEVWRFKVRGAEPLGDPKPSLIEKLCKARIAIAEKGVVPKSGYNSHIQHEYSTYDDVNGHISVPLAENGVWVHSSMVDTYKQPSGKTKGGNQRYCVTAVMEVYLTDGESRMGRRVIGENENAGDKHHYALESQLLRYALSKMLLLESGDPEVDTDPNAGTGGQAPASGGQPSRGGGGHSNDPATDNQKNYIRKLAKEAQEAGASTDDLPGLADLTKPEASDLIDELKQRKQEAQFQRASDRQKQATLEDGEGE